MDDDEIDIYYVLRVNGLDATRHVLGSIKQLLPAVDADLMHMHIELLEKGPELGEEEVSKLWYKIHELGIEIDNLQKDHTVGMEKCIAHMEEAMHKHLLDS